MRKFSIDELNTIIEGGSEFELSDKFINQSTALREVLAHPSVKAKQSAAQKEAQNRPEVKAHRKATDARPEVSARRSASGRAKHARPDVKANVIAAQSTPEMKAFRRELQKRQVTCPHCGKVGAMMVMPRWHFDNCKQRLLVI